MMHISCGDMMTNSKSGDIVGIKWEAASGSLTTAMLVYHN